MAPGGERLIERWFVRQGVPNFIRDYRASRKVWTRALPALVAWYALGIFAGVREDATQGEAVVVTVAAAAVLVGGWVGLNRLRGRPLLSRPDRVGRAEIVAFLLLPAVVPLVLAEDPALAATIVVANAVFLAVAYATTQLGLIGIVRWALTRVVAGLGEMSRLFGRALAVLVVLIGFAFFDNAVWQVADRADAGTMLAILTLFLCIALLFTSSLLPIEIGTIATQLPTERTLAAAAQTPAEKVALDPRVAASIRDRTEPHPYARREVVNLAVVILTNEAIGGLFVMLVVASALVVLGVIAVPPDLAASWTGRPVPTIVDAVPSLSWASLKVALILGGFCGLAFSVSAQSDAVYREDFERATLAAARRAAAVREIYLTGLDVDAGTLPGDEG